MAEWESFWLEFTQEVTEITTLTKLLVFLLRKEILDSKS